MGIDIACWAGPVARPCVVVFRGYIRLFVKMQLESDIADVIIVPINAFIAAVFLQIVIPAAPCLHRCIHIMMLS